MRSFSAQISLMEIVRDVTALPPSKQPGTSPRSCRVGRMKRLSMPCGELIGRPGRDDPRRDRAAPCIPPAS